MQPRSVMIMAGGTGGHVYPALAVADYLRGKGVDLYWLGTRAGLEYDVVPGHGITLFTVRVSGLRGKGWFGWLLAPVNLAFALVQALRVMLRCRPAAVLGMGGFASGPGGVAAFVLRVPILIHEQNAIAGLTNRLLFPLACSVMQGFPDTFTGAKVRTTGNPVRGDILQLSPPRERLAERRGQPLHLLVLGGSLGALVLNQVLPPTLARLVKQTPVSVWHQTGPRHIDMTRARYRELGLDDSGVVPYIDDMAAAYAWADLILCRAGALTVSEIAVAGVASILVPFPYAVDDHQTANARYLVENGAAMLLPQPDLDSDRLADLLLDLHEDRERLQGMAVAARDCGRPAATRDVGELCLEAVHA